MLTGILGTFDVSVDIAKVAGAIGNPSQLLDAFGVTGKWGISVTNLLAEVPNVFKITANGIKVAYDPNFDARPRAARRSCASRTR